MISPQTASQIALALRGVVSKRGTAAEAAVPGFTMSGKTGTAQKAAPGGGYEKNKYVVSFSGFLPSENPAFVGLVVLDDAHTKDPALKLRRHRRRTHFFPRRGTGGAVSRS